MNWSAGFDSALLAPAAQAGWRPVPCEEQNGFPRMTPTERTKEMFSVAACEGYARSMLKMIRAAAFSACVWAVECEAQSRFSYSVPLASVNVRPLPTTASTAGGVAHIAFEVIEGLTTISWTVRWERLSGLPVSATVNGPAEADGQAGVLFSLGNFFSDSTPETGAYAGFRQLGDPVHLAAIQNGRAYLTLQTGVFPGGEVRGQFPVVPEPPSGVVLAICLAAALGWRVGGGSLTDSKWFSRPSERGKTRRTSPRTRTV